MSKFPPVAVFAYNFPHKKTQDFLFRLKTLGADVRLVLAADPVPLRIPAPSVRTKIKHLGLVHPKRVASSFNFPYVIVPHNDPTVPRLVRESGATMGIIAGARILKPHVISAFRLGIINFHPGLIPEARGLDALLWSILEMIPIGVTAHLIDERVDAGTILVKRKAQLYCDDTILDLSERVYELQLEIVEEAIEKAAIGGGDRLFDHGQYNKKMPPRLEQEALALLPKYLARYAGCREEAQ